MSMVAAMVGENVNECARVIDLLHFAPKEDSAVRGQLVAQLASWNDLILVARETARESPWKENWSPATGKQRATVPRVDGAVLNNSQCCAKRIFTMGVLFHSNAVKEYWQMDETLRGFSF